MERCGIIKRIDGEMAAVEVRMTGSCSKSCEFYGICKKKKDLIKAEMLEGAKVGDMVKIEYENRYFLLYAFITFILPLLLPAAAYLIFSRVLESPLLTFIMVICALILGIILIFVTDRIIAKKGNRAKIVAVVSDEE